MGLEMETLEFGNKVRPALCGNAFAAAFIYVP